MVTYPVQQQFVSKISHQLSLTTVLLIQSDLAMVGHSPPGACNEGSGKSVSFGFFFLFSLLNVIYVLNSEFSHLTLISILSSF